MHEFSTFRVRFCVFIMCIDLAQGVFSQDNEILVRIHNKSLSFVKKTDTGGIAAVGFNHILHALANIMVLPSTYLTYSACSFTSSILWYMRRLTKTSTAFFQQCVQPMFVESNKANFTASCRLLWYESKDARINRIWYISVNQKYAINMTIMEGYVPYTRNCHPHSIQVYNTWHIRPPMETYCGHVQFEHCYSFLSFAHVKLITNTSHLYHNNSLTLAYEVMIRGLAYKFPRLYFVYMWTIVVSHTPSWLLLSEGRLKYIWYFFSNIQFRNGTSQTLSALNSREYETHGTNIMLLRLMVTAYYIQCSDESSSISVYAGLLTWYMMKWRASPLSTIPCNTRQPANTSMVPHWYTSVVLHISTLSEAIDVNIAFDIEEMSLTRNIQFKNSSSQLSYTSHARTSHILFSGFNILGPLYTVPHQHFSRRNASPLLTFQEAGTTFLITDIIASLINLIIAKVCMLMSNFQSASLPISKSR